MKVRVRYFAGLRDARGLAVEDVEGTFTTAAALWELLSAQHVFPLAPAELRVAVNTAYVPFTAALCEGDEVAFIPPVSGG